MKKFLRYLGFFVLALIVLVILIPLVFALPVLPGIQSIEELKEPDSRFIKLNGINIHYKQAGSGSTGILLLHGFGASTFSWREVLGPLSDLGTVIAYDRPAFGLTSRPMPRDWNGASPYGLEAQANLVVQLMDSQGIGQAVLVGNSAGGAVAVYTALKFPQRVKALVLVDAAIYSGGGLPQWFKPLLATPQGRWYGPLFARSIQESGMNVLQAAWHNPARITPEITTGYRKPLHTANWDRALFELTLAQEPAGLDQHLAEIKMPVLVITGDDDRIVPTAQSLRLAREIPGARLALIQFCGHVPQEECPQNFLAVVTEFIQSLK